MLLAAALAAAAAAAVVVVAVAVAAIAIVVADAAHAVAAAAGAAAAVKLELNLAQKPNRCLGEKRVVVINKALPLESDNAKAVSRLHGWTKVNTQDLFS